MTGEKRLAVIAPQNLKILGPPNMNDACCGARRLPQGKTLSLTIVRVESVGEDEGPPAECDQLARVEQQLLRVIAWVRAGNGIHRQNEYGELIGTPSGSS